MARLGCVAMVGASVFVTGCAGSSSPTQDECTNTCESILWGRLVIAAFAADDAGAHSTLTATAELSDGMKAALSSFQCRDLPPPYDCTFIASATPKATWAKVTVTTDAGSSSLRVDLKPYDRCARDMAYVHVLVPGASAPTFGDVSYINPCENAP